MKITIIAGAALLVVGTPVLAQDANSAAADRADQRTETRVDQRVTDPDRIAQARKQARIKAARAKATRIKNARNKATRKKNARIKQARLKHTRIKQARLKHTRIKQARRKASAGR